MFYFNYGLPLLMDGILTNFHFPITTTTNLVSVLQSSTQPKAPSPPKIKILPYIYFVIQNELPSRFEWLKELQ